MQGASAAGDGRAMVRGSCRRGAERAGAVRSVWECGPAATLATDARRAPDRARCVRAMGTRVRGHAPNGSFRGPARETTIRACRCLPRLAGPAAPPVSASSARWGSASSSSPRLPPSCTYVFGQNFMDRFMPTGRATTYELVIGALAWTFALTAPAGFGLVGIARLVDRLRPLARSPAAHHPGRPPAPRDRRRPRRRDQRPPAGWLARPARARDRPVRRRGHRGAAAARRRSCRGASGAGRSASATATSGRSRTRWSARPTTPSASGRGCRPTTATTS